MIKLAASVGGEKACCFTEAPRQVKCVFIYTVLIFSRYFFRKYSFNIRKEK